MKEPKILVSHDLLRLIAEIDEFKGKWESLKNMSPERRRQLCKVATIESVGSSTRIEGAKLSDAPAETLLSNLSKKVLDTHFPCSITILWASGIIRHKYMMGVPDIRSSVPRAKPK
jgi:hypothetical protein